jgi:hypothetical protein
MFKGAFLVYRIIVTFCVLVAEIWGKSNAPVVLVATEQVLTSKLRSRTE